MALEVVVLALQELVKDELGQGGEKDKVIDGG